MLAFSRYVGESFFIGDTTVVQINKVRGDNVLLGVEAPRHIRVARSELLARSNPCFLEDWAERFDREERIMHDVEDAINGYVTKPTEFDFPLVFDSLFDASCDFLTIRGAYSLLLETRVKNKQALYATASALDDTVARIVELLKRAGFDTSAIADYTTTLGATRATDEDFSKGVVRGVEVHVSGIVNDAIRRLTERQQKEKPC